MRSLVYILNSFQILSHFGSSRLSKNQSITASLTLYFTLEVEWPTPFFVSGIKFFRETRKNGDLGSCFFVFLNSLWFYRFFPFLFVQLFFFKLFALLLLACKQNSIRSSLRSFYQEKIDCTVSIILTVECLTLAGECLFNLEVQEFH